MKYTSMKLSTQPPVDRRKIAGEITRLIAANRKMEELYFSEEPSTLTLEQKFDLYFGSVLILNRFLESNLAEIEAALAREAD